MANDDMERFEELEFIAEIAAELSEEAKLENNEE